MRRLASRRARLFRNALEVLKGDQPMKKVSKQTPRMEAAQVRPTMTVGLDMGDRYSHYCLLNEGLWCKSLCRVGYSNDLQEKGRQ
jgi:hypothetical protein